MKLNNRGVTTIEVLLCFILVMTISFSMYRSISAFNEKKILEEAKEEIQDYKISLVKDIQDDFIKVGLTNAHYSVSTSGEKKVYTLDCDLRDGTKRQLIVEQLLAIDTTGEDAAKFREHGSATSDDYFMIKYGVSSDLTEYPLPELGYSKNANGKKIQDLSIREVNIKITPENTLTIYIGFYHPELANRYGISIASPIDYAASGVDLSNTWNFGYAP